jgi:hypothetical protein
MRTSVQSANVQRQLLGRAIVTTPKRKTIGTPSAIATCRCRCGPGAREALNGTLGTSCGGPGRTTAGGGSGRSVAGGHGCHRGGRDGRGGLAGRQRLLHIIERVLQRCGRVLRRPRQGL